MSEYSCDHCGGRPVTWECPKCGMAFCADCQFSNIDCYDIGRRCGGCNDPLPDSDGNTPTDWAALGYKP